MDKVEVDLGDRSYPVFLGSAMGEAFAPALKERFPGSRFALVTNPTIAGLHGQTLARWDRELGPVVITIADGEKYKTVSTWESVLSALLNSRLDRKAVVIAFGGGVVGDVAGFAAACFLRGVRYVQVPTTLLAMVDSGVGGKTGVNHPAGKNLIGAFHQPALVWADGAFLDTLPQREFLSGYGEMFKYAFIGGAAMFAFVRDHHEALLSRRGEVLAEGIKRSVRIKAETVSNDEKEVSGARALLNFGHTFAHALERFFNFEGILHGEAVLWGIACACDLGVRIGTVPRESVCALEEMLRKLPRSALPCRPDSEKLYEGMFSDKKVADGAIRFVLPARPGFAVIRADVPRSAVIETLERVMG
jgi:3-dehydroquinate synthase